MSWLSPSLDFENLPCDPPMNPQDDTETKRYERREIVAEWHVPIHGKIYKIEFEHGTTSGKRVIWIDEKEILRRDWMFKLVGEDFFTIEKIRCIIRVDPAPGFKYNYLLFVDGKPFKQFTERQAKALKTWVVTINDKEYRVVIERNSLNVFLNGKMREEMGEFIDGGTETRFEEDGVHFVLIARANEIKRKGIDHNLVVNGIPIEEKTLIE